MKSGLSFTVRLRFRIGTPRRTANDLESAWVGQRHNLSITVRDWVSLRFERRFAPRGIKISGGLLCPKARKNAPECVGSCEGRKRAERLLGRLI
jgi:hypothetical protein